MAKSREGEGLLFYVGPPKTGSKSAAWAAEILGIPAIHSGLLNRRALKNVDWKYFYDNPEGHKCFVEGINFSSVHKKLPKAKFFCFIRNSEEIAWSYYRHWQRAMRKATPQVSKQAPDGWSDFDKTREVALKKYIRLLKYFTQFPEAQFHLQRIEEGWPALCRFLELPEPDIPFPHKNKSYCLYDKENYEFPQHSRSTHKT